ncbi:MAG: adenylate/guanylate cyclase domain-containing protein, partial [Myxococcota bacterium]|nr:adenylate/guanylate cyclase domain-containing protein [Myxococcota bacterium]
ASERLGPGRMSAVLNEYLSVMNDVIFRHDGTIDKFIGDAIMVLFGAPLELSPEEQARRACACALDMQRAMASMQPLFAEAGIPDLSMRIGIHQGDAVVGNFGSEQRSDYTAIGPTVNLASRIESACTPGEVFVSEAIRALLPEPAVASTGSFELKGVDGPKILFALRRDPA